MREKKKNNRRLAAESRARRKEKYDKLDMRNQELEALVNKLKEQVVVLEKQLLLKKKTTNEKISIKRKGELDSLSTLSNSSLNQFNDTEDLEQKREECKQIRKRQRVNDNSTIFKGATAMAHYFNSVVYRSF